MRKVKELLAAAVGFLYGLAAQASAALAQQNRIEPKKAEDVSNKIVEVIQPVIQPLGAAIIFIAIVITAFKLIVTANKPEERARAMESIPYILGGGLVLGLALLLAGFIMGLMSSASGSNPAGGP